MNDIMTLGYEHRSSGHIFQPRIIFSALFLSTPLTMDEPGPSMILYLTRCVDTAMELFI
jgi:hypothetical protein